MATSDTAKFYCFLFFILIISTIFFFRAFISTSWNNITQTLVLRYPPSPPALPIIGHLHLLKSNRIPKSFQTLARRYGPLMQLRLGASTCMVISNATVAKEILKTQEINFSSRPEYFSSNYNIYKGSGIISVPYGTYWRFMKKLCMNELFASSQLCRFVHIREEEMMKLLESVKKSCREREVFDLRKAITDMTNGVICRTAMSTRCSENCNESEEIKELLKELVEVEVKLMIGEVLGRLAKFDIFGYGKKLRLVLQRFDRMIERIMKEHEEKEMKDCGREGRDLMDIMLEIYKDANAEVKLTRNDIKALFLDICLAGTDTSSVAIQWAMAELINHPQEFKKLREEIDSLVGSSRLVKESDVPNLPYLQAIVKETLRLHPPAPIFFRQCANDCVINGYDIKSKTRIIINSYAIMRDPNSWTDPDEFIPQRFLVNSTVDNAASDDDQNQMEMKGQDLRYLPFGNGRRGCPGASLASTVMHATIGALVQCFDWKVKDSEKVDMNSESGFAVEMEHPLLCYPITHFDPF